MGAVLLRKVHLTNAIHSALQDLSRNEALLSEWFALINELDLVTRATLGCDQFGTRPLTTKVDIGSTPIDIHPPSCSQYVSLLSRKTIIHDGRIVNKYALRPDSSHGHPAGKCILGFGRPLLCYEYI